MFDQIVPRVTRAVRLDPTLYQEVGADQNLTVQAMLVVAVAALISGLNPLIGPGRFSFFGWLFGAVLAATIGLAIGTGILFVLSKMFGGQGDYLALFRGLGFAYAPAALGVVPVIGQFIGGIWAMVCAIIAVREIQRLGTGQAVAVVLIPVVVLMLLVFLLFAALFAAIFSFGS